VFSHTEAQGDKLKCKGRKLRSDRNAGSSVVRIYIRGGSDLLCAQLNPGRKVCGSVSESRCYVGSLGGFSADCSRF